MCRHVSRTLPPRPRSVPEARSLLQECLTEWGLTEQLDDAQLTLSELVTNAVLHGRPPVRVEVGCVDGSLELAVVDADPTLPVVRPHRDDLGQDLDHVLGVEAGLDGSAEERDPRLDVGAAGSIAGGRGLLLVEALASRWGSTPVPGGGKAVWLQLPVEDSWPPAAACTCDHDPEAVQMPSGGRVLHRED